MLPNFLTIGRVILTIKMKTEDLARYESFHENLNILALKRKTFGFWESESSSDTKYSWIFSLVKITSSIMEELV